jgi:inactivated superfamily I helicase
MQRLITQLIGSTSIPFHGEPAEGIQVMGVLETRNLDFDHVLLLSCNEGNMPRGVNDTSFIPYALRKAYGLTTVDYKVAIYQHYFHRLLQRAKDVTILYNNATNDGKTAEMSRFMLQLMVENKIPISFYTLKAGQTPQLHSPKAIKKTLEVIRQMEQRFTNNKGGISPTAINTYIRCQLRFFYRYVCEIS